MYSHNNSLFYDDIRHADKSSVPPPLLKSSSLGDMPREDMVPQKAMQAPGSKIRMLRMLPTKSVGPGMETAVPRRVNHMATLPFHSSSKQPSIDPPVKHSLQSKRKVYGIPLKSVLKCNDNVSRNLRLLRPLDNSTALQVALQQQESHIQDTMHRVGKNLPIQFLKESNHREFAVKIASETVWRILVANWTLAQRRALQQWQAWTLHARKLDHNAKRRLLDRQAGLARCLHIAQDRLYRLIRLRLRTWQHEAQHRTHQLHVNMALYIQCAWRQKVARHAVSHVHARHIRLTRHYAAVVIQRHTRGVLGRRRASHLAHAKLTQTSARTIQRAFRRFVVVQLHSRQVKQDRTSDIQRVWRGWRGRRRGHDRRKGVRAAAVTYSNAQTEIAVDRSTTYVCAIMAIQRSIRHHLIRQQVRAGVQCMARRRQCFPRIQIQRSWRRYRRAVLVDVMARLVHTLVVVAKQLARKVVYHCAKLAEAKRRRGATAIQARIRGTLSRMHGFPMQYRVWYELDKQLPRCDKEPLEWEPLASTDRIKCLVVWRTKVQRWRDGCATDIQRLYRGYAVRQKFQVRQQACGDLRQLLNRPVHAYLRRLKARRVRGRWRRHRHATLASTMLAWKGMAHALSQLKTLRRGARQRQIAQWHFEKTHRRRLLRHWGECVRVQRDRARRALLATQFSNRHIQARATKQWRRGTVVEVICDVVWKLSILVDVYQRWARHASLMRRLKRLQAKVHGRIKVDLVNQWKQLHILNHLHHNMATRQRCHMLVQSHLTALHAFTRRNQLVNQRYIRMGARYGVRTWAEWVSLVKFRRDQHELCRVFRLRHMFARWKTLKAILRAKALQRQRLDAFATKCKLTRGLVQWLEATDHARDYHVLHMKSQRLFSRTFKRKAFAEWFELWSATAGKRRIASALLIQATWRGIKGRRRFAKAKALHEYKMAKRIERGVDSPECSIDNIASLLTTQQWVILYAYLPWEPPSLQFRKAFCTVATHFHLKRHTSFGFCDATQMDPVTMVSLASRLHLKRRLPSISVFWQGRGPENETSRDPPRRISRRFTKIDMQFALSSMTAETLLVFVDGLFQRGNHATAVDLQAIMRRTLVRLRIYYATQYRHRNAATTIVWWFVRQCRRRRYKNATKLQRWYRRRMAQHAAWMTAKARMVVLRQPIQLIQRVVRHFFRRVQYAHARDERLATPTLYPNAPLCMTCEVKIGVTKCIDCDEPYCDDCFAAFHKQGARANHRAVTMEFQAMHLNLCMCRRCHVRATARVCEACKMGLCLLCFEKVHSMRSGLHNHRFRRPIRLQQDPKHRLKLKKKPAYLSQLLCSDVAQVVISQHGWPSKSSVDAAAAAADKVQRDAAERESHIQAICRTLEKPVLDAFKLYDPHHQGYVGVGELRMLLTHELCIPVTKNEICDIVASIDLNHDGHLGWNEILRWLAIQIVDGAFRGTFRAVRTKALHVHKGYRKTQQHIRDVKRKLRDRWPKVVPRKKRVPPYDDVFQLHPVDDFQRKKHVFYRFLQHEFALEWIFEDMHEIDLDKQMTVFADVFVPRWNAGALGYEYLYDGTTFEHQATLFEQKWDVDLNKYVFLNMETHDTHLVDPRKEDVLYALALEAFTEVDVDGSGEVDVHELFTLLNESLCEPMTMDQVIQVMTSIDQDGTGTINFNEFYAWYGSEYSQKQIKSVKHDGLKLALRTRRQAKRIAAKSYRAGVKQGSKLIQGVKHRMHERRLQKDCEHASPETVELLMEGFDKHLIQKALMMNHNDVHKARDWLAQKQDEAAIDAATKRAASRRRREEQLHVLRRVQTSTKSGALKLAVAIKVMLFGQKLNRDAEVDYILKNLKMEIDGARQIVQDEIDPE